MKNKGVVFLLLLVSFANTVLAQDDVVTADSANLGRELFADIKEDSTRTQFEHKARQIVGSMFGTSKELSHADSLIKVFDSYPSFGIYKDNYIVVGSELFGRKDEWNSDAKFQVSIRQRLTNSVLPFKTYVFLTYTQKAFWGVFQESFPFTELNFNPSIGVGKLLTYNNRYLGALGLQLEHESNGKDGESSRSWNKITFDAMFIFRDRWILQSKFWIPIVDGENNRDITDYSGYGMTAFTYSSPRRKYNASCIITKRTSGFFDVNVALQLSVRLFDNENQHLFVEYYDGYGESLIDYNQYRQRIRMGIVIKPDFYSIF